MLFLDFWMVTFSNLIKLRGKTEGDKGDLSVKISRALRRVVFENDELVKGLQGLVLVVVLGEEII